MNNVCQRDIEGTFIFVCLLYLICIYWPKISQNFKFKTKNLRFLKHKKFPEKYQEQDHRVLNSSYGS